jgi:hypothetical protein
VCSWNSRHAPGSRSRHTAARIRKLIGRPTALTSTPIISRTRSKEIDTFGIFSPQYWSEPYRKAYAGTRVAQSLSYLELRVAHSCTVRGCGLSDSQFSLSRRPIAICPFFARDVFRTEEKPAPFTKTVNSAAPGNSTCTQTLAHPPRPGSTKNWTHTPFKWPITRRPI